MINESDLSNSAFDLAIPSITREGQQILDRLWQEKSGLPLLVLMEQAAGAAFNYIFHHLLSSPIHNESLKKENKLKSDDANPYFLILAGFGNNAGDAWALARLLTSVTNKIGVIDLAGEKSIGQAGDMMREAAKKLGIEVMSLEEGAGKLLSYQQDLEVPDYIIDGILGTGYQASRPLSPNLDAAFQLIKTYRAKGSLVISIDIPSGLEADSGKISPHNFQADLTLTLDQYKQGLFLMPGASYAGKIVKLPIGLPKSSLFAKELWQKPDQLRAISRELVQELIPPRRANSHKGHYGKGLLLAGSKSMPGALHLASEAANAVVEASLGSGLGYLYIITDPDLRLSMAATYPEALYPEIEKLEDFAQLIDQVDAIAMGPGWSQDPANWPYLAQVLLSDKPVIIDADALNLLAERWSGQEILKNLSQRSKPGGPSLTLLTPHPGEFARLTKDLNLSPASSMLDQARTLASAAQSIVLLKGSHTIVALPDERALVSLSANSGLARAGSGDVLTGLILGLCSQKLSLAEAAILAVWLHVNTAIELSKQTSERSMRVSDLARNLHLAYRLIF